MNDREQTILASKNMSTMVPVVDNLYRENRLQLICGYMTCYAVVTLERFKTAFVLCTFLLSELQHRIRQFLIVEKGTFLK